jgi:NAD(P)-dependent dehydrogenase (short-subunit alcohol dehydrogenase family)
MLWQSEGIMTNQPADSNAGDVAIVTGAAGGIGAAVVQTLLAQGYVVLAVDLHPLVVPPHPQLQWLQVDVTDDTAPVSIITAAIALGAPSVLVQAAGVVQVAHPFEVDRAHWERVMNINAQASWFIATEFLRQCVTAQRLVFVASTAGKTATTVMHPIYNISKAAVIAMTKTLAMTVADRAVTVNCVCPGVIDTDMQMHITAALAARGADATEVWQQRIARVPMQRVGLASEVAQMVGFLVSDAASYTTGQAVHVCGGMVM